MGDDDPGKCYGNELREVSMDALQLLTSDHNRVRGLFTLFKQAHESEDSTRMQSIAQKVVQELTVHTAIEEEVFYPQVKSRSDEISEMVDEALQEHHVAKSLIEELKTVEPAGDEWAAKMQVLIENVEHHAEEEEKEMFPKVRAASSADELNSLATRLESAKRQHGAPTAKDNIDLTVDQLHKLASEQQIPGRSKMTKEELAATVAPG
jgi:hemerythrin superfamily protein